MLGEVVGRQFGKSTGKDLANDGFVGLGGMELVKFEKGVVRFKIIRLAAHKLLQRGNRLHVIRLGLQELVNLCRTHDDGHRETVQDTFFVLLLWREKREWAIRRRSVRVKVMQIGD